MAKYQKSMSNFGQVIPCDELSNIKRAMKVCDSTIVSPQYLNVLAGECSKFEKLKALKAVGKTATKMELRLIDFDPRIAARVTKAIHMK